MGIAQLSVEIISTISTTSSTYAGCSGYRGTSTVLVSRGVTEEHLDGAKN